MAYGRSQDVETEEGISSYCKILHNREKLQLLFFKCYSNMPTLRLVPNLQHLICIRSMLMVDITCTCTSWPTCVSYYRISEARVIVQKARDSWPPLPQC